MQGLTTYIRSRLHLCHSTPCKLHQSAVEAVSDYLSLLYELRLDTLPPVDQTRLYPVAAVRYVRTET
jgi:hypothetical protein